MRDGTRRRASPRLWRFALAAALVAETYLLLSPVVRGPAEPAIPRLDLVFHAGSFAVLGALAALAFRAPRVALWSALVAYGLATEIAQHYLPPRTFALTDLAADALGAATLFAVPRSWQAARARGA